MDDKLKFGKFILTGMIGVMTEDMIDLTSPLTTIATEDMTDLTTSMINMTNMSAMIDQDLGHIPHVSKVDLYHMLVMYCFVLLFNLSYFHSHLRCKY